MLLLLFYWFQSYSLFPHYVNNILYSWYIKTTWNYQQWPLFSKKNTCFSVWQYNYMKYNDYKSFLFLLSQNGRRLRARLFFLVFSVSWSPPVSEESVYLLPRISSIRKEPQVLNLCSTQLSNSTWPHAKTQCASRHLCTFPFSRAKESPALTVQVICTDTSHNEKPWTTDPVPPPVFQGIAQLMVQWTWDKRSLPWHPWPLHQELVGEFQNGRACTVTQGVPGPSPVRSVTFWQREFIQVPCELRVLPSDSV